MDDGYNLVHKFLVSLVHLHVVDREERAFGESLAFFLAVVQQGEYLCCQVIERERFLNVCLRTQAQAVDFAVEVVLGGQEDDGDMAQFNIGFHLFT